MVVVADDHDVVRPVRRPAEQLDQLDLGDVRVLEFVDEDVAELALVAAQDVRPLLEEAGDEADLLAEVEGAAAGKLLLIGAVDEGELGQAKDLEGGAIGDVGVGQRVDAREVGWRELVARQRAAVARDGSSRLAVGDLLDSRQIRGGRCVTGLLGPFGSPEVRVGLPNLAQRRQVALRLEASERLVVVAVSGFEGLALAVDERVEVIGRYELVFGPVDERHELVEPVVRITPAGVVEERQVGPNVAQEQHLTDAVEDVGLGGQAGIRRGLGQDPMAEAVEVADAQACPGSRSDRGLDPVAELLGRLDVVRQDQDLLGQQGTGERIIGNPSVGGLAQHEVAAGCRGGLGLRFEQPAHALDDDPGLAGASARDHDRRPIAPFDDSLLRRRQVRSHRGSEVGHRPSRSRATRSSVSGKRCWNSGSRTSASTVRSGRPARSNSANPSWMR